ncbi:toprim domain-containing protein, partial [Pseudomonadota bacterium]
GIGREEYNPDKLRYHRIIIMTDADVDGSHIRTLLLTFFYRQMPEMIERGHVYIAQPPLYKLKKGKQERYVKDDLELNQYLMQMALDKASLIVAENSPPISGESLESLAISYTAVMATIERLSVRYCGAALEKMIYMSPLTDTEFSASSVLLSWASELTHRLNDSDETKGTLYEVSTVQDEEGLFERFIITQTRHSISKQREITREFFGSGEYRSMVQLGEQLNGLINEGAEVRRGERNCEITSFKQALTWLMDEAKRGQQIQRYKGLGEMNPEQLWETTLNSETRRLLQVKIEDAVAADEIFTTLMGDQVEPRRDFIERNALSVSNLDV